MAANLSFLTPTVLWAQRKEMIALRIPVQPLETPDFKIHDTHMTFSVLGIGSSGKNRYQFDLTFHDTVDTEKCRLKLSEKEIEFRLLKRNVGEWPKLQSKHVKPHWIKTDFDRFHVSDDEEEEDEATRERKQLIKSFEEKTRNQVEFYNKLIDIKDMTSTIYLILYNVVQFILFLIISLRLLFLLAYGWNGIERAYGDVSPLIMISFGLSSLEVVHSATGLVKGAVLTVFLQVLGRSFSFFAVIQLTEEIHTNVFVYILFLCWSLMEIIRYPYYIVTILNKNMKWLTWLRYTLWIPIYPTGITCEFILMVLAVLYGPPGGGWQYLLPNQLNVSISVRTITIILLVLYPYFAFIMLGHMHSQRKNKLKTKKR